MHDSQGKQKPFVWPKNYQFFFLSNNLGKNLGAHTDTWTSPLIDSENICKFLSSTILIQAVFFLSVATILGYSVHCTVVTGYIPQAQLSCGLLTSAVGPITEPEDNLCGALFILLFFG